MEAICIENQYGGLLNRMVSEMISRDFTLKAIENYVKQVENFLNFVSAPEIRDVDMKSYLNNARSDTSLQALHFFFREILSNLQQEEKRPPPNFLFS